MEFGSRTLKSLTTRGLTKAPQRLPVTAALGRSVPAQFVVRTVERERYILPDKINILFTDTPFYWDKDRLLIERYARGLRQVVQQALGNEEAILIAVYPVYDIE